MFFILFVLNFFFINSTKHVFLFLRTKTVFQNSVPKHNFFLKKHQKLFLKIVLKNCFPKQFSKTTTKQALKDCFQVHKICSYFLYKTLSIFKNNKKEIYPIMHLISSYWYVYKIIFLFHQCPILLLFFVWNK